ncbi:hypothetical protein EIP91_005134 [Steccherinum ochraceum]|uniref:Uncharacterized protein n=1 Tax=Steccherinum ochraceum TaxID=92696 RepID=A0A4R0RMV4_9APHY|nr:hypothetical protein EIP91_005134 [Steccherinum ochraceum]
MRFAIIVSAILAAAASSVVAVPFHAQPREYDANAMVARNYNLVLRDVLQAIHTRELAHMDARVLSERTLDLAKRDPPPVPDEDRLSTKADVTPEAVAARASDPRGQAQARAAERAMDEQDNAEHTANVVAGRTAANPNVGVNIIRIGGTRTPSQNTNGRRGGPRVTYSPFAQR